MRQKGKRIFAFAMILILVFSMAGCKFVDSKKSSKASESEQKSKESEETSQSTEATEETESVTESESETESISESETETASESETESSEETSKEESTESSVEEPDEEKETVLTHYQNVFVVTGAECLNIRRKASKDSAIVGSLDLFAGGEILDVAEGGEWYHIRSGVVEGYVNANYIVSGEEAQQEAVKHAVRRLEVTADVANLRTSPKDDADVFDQAAKGMTLDILGEQGDFFWVRDSYGDALYVNKSVVQPGWFLKEAVWIDAEKESEESEESKESEETEETTEAEHPVTGAPVICIDAGHQQHGISETEPNGPGSTVMKAKLTTGTSGCVTGAAEYQVNLDVSLKLQSELVARGYTVVMIRTTNDCPLSNAERAQIANSEKADAFVRIHCNSLDNPDVTGVMNYAASPANPYLSADLVSAGNRLAAILADRMCAATGAVNRGVLQDDTMTGINWCQVPVAIVEMGFMSNPTEDRLLSDPEYQRKLAIGMADGLDAYFGR